MSESDIQVKSPLEIVNNEIHRIVNSIPYREDEWSTLAKVVFRRTYLRSDSGRLETFREAVERVIRGNVKNVDPKFLKANEVERLAYFMLNRKASPAGRGLWFSGSPSHDRIGGAALNNCWFVTADDWKNFVIAQDLLMLGGGVGMSVEHRFVSRMPKLKKGVKIVCKNTKDADFIVPDSREGWCDLTNRVLESYFVTGRSFSYSTVCIRGYGESIKGFGGLASGPLPVINCISKLCDILSAREGKHLRPIDAADILCCIGELVVSGNVRRSALMIMGDAWDKEYLKAKRWDLGPMPSQRAMANFSVVCEDVDDLHPLFWKTYDVGEPFGIINRKNMQTYGRMGEKKKDSCIGVNPCGEATLEDGEPCNLQEIFLPNLSDENEFYEASRLMHRYGKRVTMESYHHDKSDNVIRNNRRVGTGVTGCLRSDLFTPRILDKAYQEIQKENESYSRQMNIAESIRTTVVKPSGTMSIWGDCTAGIHPAFSRHEIRRVRFSANDSLIPILRAAGHYMEPVKKLDGTLDHGTLVVDFYRSHPENTPCADENFDTWKQLETVLMAQKYWSDQSVSVTVYYKREEIPKIKEWLAEHLHELKTISFLCHSEHGFEQAPLEAISKEQYDKLSGKLKPVSLDDIDAGSLGTSLECEGGVCPIK